MYFVFGKISAEFVWEKFQLNLFGKNFSWNIQVNNWNIRVNNLNIQVS